jgi:hypothetical protein
VACRAKGALLLNQEEFFSISSGDVQVRVVGSKGVTGIELELSTWEPAVCLGHSYGRSEGKRARRSSIPSAARRVAKDVLDCWAVDLPVEKLKLGLRKLLKLD